MNQKEPSTGRFSDLGIAENFLASLTKKGFTTPTPIQHQIIPGALQGKDVVGIAQTGTGKTLAFGIPMIQQISQQKGTQGLILTPTRELASQIDEALKNIGRSLGLRTAVIIGGVSKQGQYRSLKNNPHIVIATPGRLADLMKEGVYKLNNVSIITLDEADRMLDVGFLPEIKRILKAAPPKRQTMLFSATMEKSISKLASAFMKLPLRIEIAPQGTSSKNIEQEVFIIRKPDKMRLLDSLLTEYAKDTTLIFSRTKHGAKKIARDIRNMGHTATEIHGNRSQNQRQKALAGFTKGAYRVMVATDIAARGIDVQDISLVINYDLPDNSADYVHRIGRTGRAGRSGKAISFVTPGQKADIRSIERLIRKTLPVLDLPNLPAPRPKAPKEERPEQNRNRRQRHQGGKSRGNQKRKSNNSANKDISETSTGGGKRNREYSRNIRSSRGSNDTAENRGFRKRGRQNSYKGKRTTASKKRLKEQKSSS